MTSVRTYDHFYVVFFLYHYVGENKQAEGQQNNKQNLNVWFGNWFGAHKLRWLMIDDVP